MRPPKTPQEALDSEFTCYYSGDEISSVQSESFRSTLPRQAWDSAHRMRSAVGENHIPALVAVLESLKAEPYGPLMCNLMEGSLIGWADDPQDWAVFQILVDRIIQYLNADPGPRPQ